MTSTSRLFNFYLYTLEGLRELDFNKPSLLGDTPVRRAVAKGDVNMLKALMEIRNPDGSPAVILDTPGKDGRTLAQVAMLMADAGIKSSETKEELLNKFNLFPRPEPIKAGLESDLSTEELKAIKGYQSDLCKMDVEDNTIKIEFNYNLIQLTKTDQTPTTWELKDNNAYSGSVKFTTKDETFIRSLIEVIIQKDFKKFISLLSKNNNRACKKIAKHIQGELDV